MTVVVAPLSDSAQWSGFLTAEERAAGKKKSSDSMRSRFEIGRGIRRRLLSEASGISAAELRFTEDGNIKPYAENAAGWDFNLSHAGEFVACAVARGPVGIDIELIRPVREMGSIVTRYFHPDEAAAWRAAGKDLREEAFFVLWSAREAVMKCTGLGLARGLSITRVDPAILREAEASARAGDAALVVRRLEAPPGYVALVALAAGR